MASGGEDCKAREATSSASNLSCVDRAKAIYVFANEKGGMANINSEVINKIILETSGNSAYTAKQLKSDAKVDESVEAYRRKLQLSDSAQRRAAASITERRTAEFERERRLDRVCVVIDFDMFYAAVEIRDRPELADKPVAVGGIGMISTANYVARRWGVRSAMPGFVGQALCRRGPEFGMPSAELLFVTHDFAKYEAVAQIARAIFREYDAAMRSFSLDEAYLDLTSYLRKRMRLGSHALAVAAHDGEEESEAEAEGWENGGASVFEEEKERMRRMARLAEVVVAEMRARVQQATDGLTTSAGIGPNPMLAKIAADQRKPNGQFCVGTSREDVLAFLAPLPTRKVPGIGRVQEKLLASVLGVRTCGDLLAHAAEVRIAFTAHTADALLRKALGCCDESEPSPESDARDHQKGISCERTFRATGSAAELREILRRLCERLAAQMEARGLEGRVLTLKAKSDRFDVITRDVSCGKAISSQEDLYNRTQLILDKILSASKCAASSKESLSRPIAHATSPLLPPSPGHAHTTFCPDTSTCAARHDSVGTSAASSLAPAPSSASRTPDEGLRLRLMGVRVSKLTRIKSTATGISSLLVPKVSLADPAPGSYSRESPPKGDSADAEERASRGLDRDTAGVVEREEVEWEDCIEGLPRSSTAAQENKPPLKYQRLRNDEVDPAVLAELPAAVREELAAEMAATSAEQRLRTPHHSAKRKLKPLGQTRRMKEDRAVAPARQGLLAAFMTKGSASSGKTPCSEQDTEWDANECALLEMGFRESAARAALESSQGSLRRALEMLLASACDGHGSYDEGGR